MRSGAPTVPECNTSVIKTVCQINVSANYKQKSLSYVLKTLICLQHLCYFIPWVVTECLHVICSGLWGILTTKQTESEYFLRRAWCHLNVWKAPFASSQLIPDRPIRGGLACVPCVLSECSVPAWCWMMCFLALTPLWLFFGVSWSLEPTLSRLVVWSATQPRWLQGCPLSLSLRLARCLAVVAADSGRPPRPISLHRRLAASCQRAGDRGHLDPTPRGPVYPGQTDRQTNEGKQGRGGCLSLMCL